MKNIRLKDIADRLNISTVAVSKALRDQPDISEETREKVKKLAVELGYRPNLQARSLTSKKTKTVGLIIPKIAHYFFSAVTEGIYKTALDSGYKVIMGVSFEDRELELKNIESMLNMRVDGLLISVTEQTREIEIFEEVRNMGIDLVFFDRGFENKGFSYVRVSDQTSAQNGVEHLIKLGYKNIAHLSGYEAVHIGYYRKRGYCRAMEENGITVAESAVVEGGFSEMDGYKGLEKLIRQHGQPEALFAVTYPVGLGALQKMKEMDIDPNELPILAFGGSAYNDYLATPLICINQPTYELGKLALNQLLKEMDTENSKGELIELVADVEKAQNG